jgi:hypothetical protein
VVSGSDRRGRLFKTKIPIDWIQGGKKGDHRHIDQPQSSRKILNFSYIRNVPMSRGPNAYVWLDYATSLVSVIPN